jgi:hypothetical protein
MKKGLLMTGVLLALTATVASAEGINYSWNECYASGGVGNKTFACNVNTGTNISIATYDPPPGLTLVNGSAVLLDLQSASNPLPLWWHYKNAGTCRLASLTVSADFTSNLTDCADFWAGAATAGTGAYTIGFGGNPAYARLSVAIAVPGASAGPVSAGTEYYDVKINFNNAKTVGTGACAGCLDPVCLVVNNIQLTQPTGTPGGSPNITAVLQQNHITWQGGVIGGAGCPAEVPTQSRTWGQVKSIYR